MPSVLGKVVGVPCEQNDIHVQQPPTYGVWLSGFDGKIKAAVFFVDRDLLTLLTSDV